MSEIISRIEIDRKKIQQLRAEKSEAVVLCGQAQEVSEQIRDDLMQVLGRITGLKTIWALIPQALRDVIAKYTDVTSD